MSYLELIKKIEKQFLFFRDHSSFLVRERLYKGGNVFGNGLKPVHEALIKLIDKTEKTPVPLVFIETMTEDYNLHILKLEDTLQLLMFMIDNDGDNDEVKKIFSVIEMEIQDLDDFFSQGHTFDPSTIQSEEELASQRIFDLGLKIEDNFNQLSTSAEWRRIKTISHVDSEIDFEELTNLIDQAKKYALMNVSEDNLSLLSLMAINIRDIAAANLSRLKESILLFITTSKILGEDLSFKKDDTLISAKSVKGDVEHRVNLKKIQWVVNVHNSVIEEFPEEKYAESFAVLLYRLSRDAREEFLWSMLRLAREQSNEELEDVSIAYASLASMLLSVNDTIKQAGLEDLSNAITQAEEIKAMDAIDDLGEIYSLNEFGTERLVRAIRKQLEKLKVLAYQIIQMDDIRPTFKMIVQFTDMESNLDSGRTLEDYLESLGAPNKPSAWEN